MERGKRAATEQPRQRKIISLNMDASFFFERAVQSLDRLHYDKALKYFKRAVEYEPENPVNYYNMAGILSEIGNFEESNEVLKQLLDSSDTGMTECYFYMANNYANMEQFEQAEDAIVRYLEQDPDGQYLEEAEEIMDYLSYELDRPAHVRNIKSREEFFEHDRARTLLEEGRFLEATRLLEKLVKKSPDFTAARNNLALAYYYLGRFETCLNTIKEVLERDKGNLHALCNLAIVYKHAGQEEDLQELVRMLGKTYPYHHEHLFKLATTMGILGEHEAAYRHFKRLLRNNPMEDACLYHYCAVSAFNTGRHEDAEKFWKMSDRADSDSRIARFYLSELESMKQHREMAPLSYHYHLPYEESFRQLEQADDPLQQYIRRDPLLRSSFLWALRHGDEDTKLQVIKAMGMSRDQEMQLALREFLLEPEESDYLKKVAIFVLRGMGVQEQLEVSLDGKRTCIQHETMSPNLPTWSEKWQQVMDLALGNMRHRYDMVQQHDLQTLWVEYLSRVYPNTPRMVKINGWAAALEYLTAKMHRRTASYRDVADRYDVSVTTVRNIVDRIDEACGLRDKMKAIFPQFSGKL